MNGDVGGTSEAKPIKEASWRQGLNEVKNQMDEDKEDVDMINEIDDKEEKYKQTENNEKLEENNTFEGLFFFKENDERLKKGIKF